MNKISISQDEWLKLHARLDFYGFLLERYWTFQLLDMPRPKVAIGVFAQSLREDLQNAMCSEPGANLSRTQAEVLMAAEQFLARIDAAISARLVELEKLKKKVSAIVAE